MGLYGERVGALHVVCANKSYVANVQAWMKTIIRRTYSNPPRHGAKIAAAIMNVPEKRQQWLDELVTVTSRITKMREALRKHLEDMGTPGTWNHVTDQIGMFSFTGLSEAQSTAMIEKHHIYMTKNGRVSIAGLNDGNVEYVAKAIKDVVENF